MLPTFATARLVVRPREMADLDACVAMDAEAEVTRYVGGAWDGPGDYRGHLRRRFAERYPPGLGYWSIVDGAAPEGFLGWVALVPHGDGGDRVEIGWRVVRAAWGRGIATEAAAPVLCHGLETLGPARVVADIHPGNAASVRVAKKLGLRFTGEGTYGGERCLCFAAARGERGRRIDGAAAPGSRFRAKGCT